MNKKIEMFQKLAQGEECMIGSGRCGSHNTKLVKDITVKRVSEVNNDNVVSWVMRDVITLVCPAARHTREDRLGDYCEEDRQSISGGKRGPNKKIRTVQEIVDDQPASRSQTGEGED